MTIKAIIFDVDGTLADTEDGHRKSFNKAFAENGLDWNWDVALYDKLLKVTGGKERIKYFVEDFLTGFTRPEDFEEFVKHLHEVKTAHYTAMLREGHIPLRPGIRQLLDDARNGGHRASPSPPPPRRRTSRPCCEVGLGPEWENYFAAIGCGDIVPHKETRAGHLFLGAGKTGACPPPIASRWKIPKTDCTPASQQGSELSSLPTTSPASRIFPARQQYSTTCPIWATFTG